MSDRLREHIKEAGEPLKAAGAREVYVFGAAATGTLREDSDIDLAVSSLPPQNFFRAMSKAVDILGHELDLIDLDDDTPFTRYLREEEELRACELIAATPQTRRFSHANTRLTELFSRRKRFFHTL